MRMKSISKLSSFLLLAGLFLGLTDAANAQMFSVKSEPSVSRPPSTGAYFGLEPAKFMYKPSSNDNNPYTRYTFSDPLYQLRLELPGIDIYLSSGWNLGNSNYLNFFNIGAQIQRVYPFFKSRHFIVGAPIRIQTDYLQVNSQRANNNADDFQQSSGTLGSGPAVLVRLGKGIRFTTVATINYGFSVRSLGATSGSLYIINSQNRLYFDHLINDVGLSIGYDYDFSRYNLTGVRYDYALRGNSIVIGITF